MNPLSRIALGFVLAALASAMPVQGAAIYWDGGPFGTGTDFNDPENWNPDGFPGAADSATVQNGGTAIISADPPNAIDYFYLARNSDTLGHVVHTGGTLTINRDFHVSSLQRCVSTYHQSGGKIIQSPTNTVYMRIGGSDFSYGYYDLSGGEIEAYGLFVGAGTGAGSNNESLGILNQTGGSVTVRTAYSAIGNSGAAMGVYNLTGGTFTQLAGHFRVGGGGSLAPNGQLNVSGTGQFDLKQEYMYVAVHATSQGFLNLGSGGSVTVPYIMPGAGTARVNFHGGTLRANSDQADFVRLDAHVYGGGAKIDTAGYDVTITKNLLAPTGYGVASIAVDYGGDAYVGPPAVRITGGTGSGATAIANVSEGVVTGVTITNPGSGYQADDVLTVELLRGGAGFAATAGAVTFNSGNTSGGLEKLGLGTLALAGDNTYTGVTMVRAGALSVTGSLAGGVALDVGAALMGTGTVGGNVIGAGNSSIAPGTSAGMLTLGGNLDMAAGVNMIWELAALSEANPGADFDVLAVSGDLILGGTSTLTLDFGLLDEEKRPGHATLDDFWKSDRSWKVVDVGEAGFVTGNFASLANGSFAHGAFGTSVIGNDVFLNYVASIGVPIPGDADRNGVVDAEDAKRLAESWGKTSGAKWEEGDFNGDGRVDAIDAAVLAANWGYSRGTAEATAGVPEPAAIAMIVIGLLSLCVRTRRTRCL